MCSLVSETNEENETNYSASQKKEQCKELLYSELRFRYF